MNILETIDNLLENGKIKEAEQYMCTELEKARDKSNKADELMLLNELIGFYRQASEKEKLLVIIEDTNVLVKSMGIENSISGATTYLNVATAYRSIGELEPALNYYNLVEKIYISEIEKGNFASEDMRLAGFYNNIALLYQELSEFAKSLEYLKRALDISIKNDSGFEIATTYANMANTYLGLMDIDNAIKNANTSIRLFKERNFLDPHYCAALSALGNCYMIQGRYNDAQKIIVEAMGIIESLFGKNYQYDRLSELLEKCNEKINNSEDNAMKTGMQLCNAFYNEYGKKMLQDKYDKYADRIEAGLIGEGSECFGFDDEYSKDHDFGPGFCIWLPDNLYEKIGKEMSFEYDKLIKAESEPQKVTTEFGQGRRGVFSISDFFVKHIGTIDPDHIDYSSVPDYELAVCSNGQLFTNINGEFSKIYSRLKLGYPQDIRLKKMAQDVAYFTQCGQYNYFRMRDRGDRFTAKIMLADFCKYAMKLYHHFMNAYPPHDKWLKKSTESLDGGDVIIAMLENVMKQDASDNTALVRSAIDAVADHFAMLLYQNSDISDVDNYLDHHINELLFKADIALLSIEELTEKIVRLEFEAFDKVENEGGRASCQNNWPTFSIMRKSQYYTWDREMLMQYLYDFNREYRSGHNLITEKYGRMMESTDQNRFNELKEYFPELTEEKRAIIEQIVKIQMDMVEEFAKEHPGVASNARNLHTSQDNIFDTSYETYLRGEISTYSDKMLQLYGRYVVTVANEGRNIAYMTISNTASLYGFKSLEDFEKH